MEYFEEPQGTQYENKGTLRLDRWYSGMLERADVFFKENGISLIMAQGFLNGLAKVVANHPDNPTKEADWNSHLNDLQKEFTERTRASWFTSVGADGFLTIALLLMKKG